MKQGLWINLAAAALLLPWAMAPAPALAAPGPPLSCAGVPGEGGCAPYANVAFDDSAGAINLYEYELPSMAIGRSLPLSDVHGSVHLSQGTLAARARHASDDNPSNGAAARVTATAVDLYTLHSATALPPGLDFINIVARVSTQGVGSIDTDYHVVQSLLHLGIGGGVVAYNGGVLDSQSVLQSGTHVPTFQQFVVPLDVYANITVRVGVPFELGMSLLAIASESTFLNFDSHFGLARPAQLSFLLPTDFSVTSMGGYDSLTAVPEPGSTALWLAGLGVIGLRLQRRRSSAQRHAAARRAGVSRS